MQISFAFTVAEQDMVPRAAPNPGAVLLRNMRHQMRAAEGSAKCPLIPSGTVSETVVLPTRIGLTTLAKDNSR